MKTLLSRLLAVWIALRANRRERPVEPEPASEDPPPQDPSRRDVTASRSVEALVAGLLVACGVVGVIFVVLYVVNPDTQLLGLAGGLALILLALALGLASLCVVPQETAVEDRPPLGDGDGDREREQDVRDDVRSGADGVSRRRLLTAAAGVAGAGLTAAAAVPLASLGPAPGGRLGASPWRAGLRLVDEEGRPISAQTLELGGFLTAFPEEADPRELGSPVVVVRLTPQELRLPAARADWAPEGLLAFSRICTHAGCAISEFRYPLYEPTSSPPALVCPCHYSTFDVRRAARVLFGPAGRPLPQLPLAIDPAGDLRAAGPLSGPVGPAWWGVSQA